MEQETKRCPYCGEEILAVAKKCKHCGEWLNNDEKPKEEIKMVSCPVCGEMIEDGSIQCPHCHEPVTNEVTNEPKNETIPETNTEDKARSFFNYYFVEPFIKHYFKFRGRINRKHFWISILLWFAFTILIGFSVEIMASTPIRNIIVIIFWGWVLLSIIPLYAIVLRRMRDGDSELSLWGWWFYLLPIPYMIIISVQKSPLWLCIIPFVILLWWLVKPSDNEMRDDGLAIDKQPKVRFKKSDKIMLIVLLILFLLGGLTLSYYNNKKADVVELTDEQLETRTEQPELIEEQVEEEYSTKREKTPYNILSVDEALLILGFYPNHKIVDMLSKKYNYDDKIQFSGGEYETEFWIKDCVFKKNDDDLYELISKSEKSSTCLIEIGHRIDVDAFDKNVLNSWRSQIIALGYTLESEDESRYGLEWKWKKNGEPYIKLSDDQSGMFSLTIERNE